jgi:hypothetical protein
MATTSPNPMCRLLTSIGLDSLALALMEEGIRIDSQKVCNGAGRLGNGDRGGVAAVKVSLFHASSSLRALMTTVSYWSTFASLGVRR